MQLGRAEPINTFSGWKALGRHVKKGEKAIELLIPIFKKAVKETTKGKRDQGAAFFMPRKNWFGIHQTDGDEYKAAIPGFDIDKALRELNISIEPFQHMNGNCQGYAKTDQRIIAISPIAFDNIKTSFHEVAHVLWTNAQPKTACHATLKRWRQNS